MAKKLEPGPNPASNPLNPLNFGPPVESPDDQELQEIQAALARNAADTAKAMDNAATAESAARDAKTKADAAVAAAGDAATVAQNAATAASAAAGTASGSASSAKSSADAASAAATEAKTAQSAATSAATRADSAASAAASAAATADAARVKANQVAADLAAVKDRVAALEARKMYQEFAQRQLSTLSITLGTLVVPVTWTNPMPNTIYEVRPVSLPDALVGKLTNPVVSARTTIGATVTFQAGLSIVLAGSVTLSATCLA